MTHTNGKTLTEIADEVTTSLIRDARTNGLQMKDVRLPEFQGSISLLRDLLADWLEKNMEIDRDAQLANAEAMTVYGAGFDLTGHLATQAVAAGRAE